METLAPPESTCCATTPYTEPRLNYDVLIHITSFLRQHELVPVMQTCEILRRECTKRLITTGPLVRSEGGCQSFCRFMLVDRPTRFKLLRKIDLNVGRDALITSTSTAKLLTEVLLACSRLEELKIFCGRLCSGRYDEYLIRLGSHTFKTLRKLTLNCTDADIDNAETMVVVLGACFEVLEELEIYNLFWLRYAGPLPHLRKLKILMSDRHQYYVAFLSILCPNLKELDWDYDSNFIPRYHPSEHLRKFSAMTQRRFESQGGRWRHLECLSGHINVLYEASLACEVDILRPRYVCLIVNTDIVYLRDLLNQTRPRHLILDIELSALVEPPEFPAKKLVSTNSGMMELSLNINIGELKPEALPASRIIASIVRLFKRLRIGTFNLDFTSQPPDRYTAGDKGIEPVTNSLRKLQATPFIEQLADGIPSLRHVSVQIPLNPRYEWDVGRSSEGEARWEQCQ
ncbi:hypothetical protein OBBRIDRAFT_885737 [Obba rivulosa]|uniref:F-box domain-containing protein n=1 Tax=Obba rivulosa TaxID=1052685 RepID=A0A8E2AXT3_9APHY|nr:hypothetical protein OBBRIDRAFT_885737 [Obba rivulosa]